uniref:Sushi domain-containing protein n=1 Tax=Pseudonaja textilis TaxID=8673 RepID=A0A670Y875_PSETE
MRCFSYIIFVLLWTNCVLQKVSQQMQVAYDDLVNLLTEPEIPTTCGPPPAIGNAMLLSNGRQEFLSGESVIYQCYRLYEMEGTPIAMCENGHWRGVPRCVQTCRANQAGMDRNNIQLRGLTKSTSLRASDYWMEFECKPGFPPCILTKQQLDDRNLLLNDGQRHSEWIRNGHTIEFTCRKGYSIVSPSVRKCVDGNLTLPSCNSSVICPAPRVENGSFFPLWMSYNVEDIIYTTCKPGYMLESHKNISKCTKGGWFPNPKCVRKQCDFPLIENGALSWSNIFYSDVSFPKKVGQTIGFKCNHGFLARNKKHWDRIKCTNFGWDPEPQCYKQCIPPKHLPHGRVTYNYGNTFIDGDEISFNCDMGYYPEHHLPIATCRNNDWFPTMNCVSTDIDPSTG